MYASPIISMLEHAPLSRKFNNGIKLIFIVKKYD